MNDSKNTASPASAETATCDTAETASAKQVSSSSKQHAAARNEARRWWIKLLVQPVLFLACGALLIVGLGVAQRLGFISSGGAGGRNHAASSGGGAARYICPMMCTPPQAEPGRCPVCAMELVPITSGGGESDFRSVHIEPAARRLANIHTVAVASSPITRTIRAIGELNYDEGSLKTLSAYVDGRLDRLYADYTGVVVNKGDQLALVYSPRLYSSQVELLLARKSREDSRGSALARVKLSNGDLYASARERLVLLGMTEQQIKHLEETGVADSRLQLCAPISGTVIEKLAVEGQYVKEGDAIYKLADLSTVWLMLKVFPEDAATIRYGQKVEMEVQSLPGRGFNGRVAFIDPQVDPKTRTVGVRVVMNNDEGLLRVGDYARATVDAPFVDAQNSLVYDPELANKWISPRHPHMTADSAGPCPICGVPLVPAASLGFTDQPNLSNQALVVPRDAVLMAGDASVVYVETEPGRFELRRVELGPTYDDQIVIRSGVERGEQVATRGNFLIDSQMQLAGNPSLIDPTRLQPADDEAMSPETLAALSGLSAEDRALVGQQRICPVADSQLGSMGPPRKVDVNGTSVFICCEGCRQTLLADPEKYLAKLESAARQKAPGDNAPSSPRQDLPPIDVPKMLEPKMLEPKMLEPKMLEPKMLEPEMLEPEMLEPKRPAPDTTPQATESSRSDPKARHIGKPLQESIR